MGIWTLFLLALGLSMDAFAVSITNGLCVTNISKKQTLQVGLAFGLAQGIMPILGFLAGQTFSRVISSLDHWIALVLLGAIGGKMAAEAIREMRSGENVEDSCIRTLTLRTLVLQAIATSIDALAVGVSLAALRVNIWMAASFIACITFLFGIVGVCIGKKSGAFLKSKAELVGGVILVLIGVKIFVEHMWGG